MFAYEELGRMSGVQGCCWISAVRLCAQRGGKVIHSIGACILDDFSGYKVEQGEKMHEPLVVMVKSS